MVTKRRSAKKKDGARSVRHGNVTYSSRPSDNTDCRIRCSPPSRQTFGDGSKQTTVRYRHRTLDIKSPPSGKKRKPGVRTGPKTVPKTATKTTPVKTVKKAPAKKTVPKTVPKAPKAPETPSKLSALVKELEKEVQKPKAPAKKPTAREVILKKAAEEGMNAKELDKHLIVGGIPKAEPKTTAKKPVAKATAEKPAKSNGKEVTIRMSAPLSVQKRTLAKQRAKAQAKQAKQPHSAVDVMNPDSPRPDPHEIFYHGYTRQKQEMPKYMFAHVYSLEDDDRINYPSNTYHVVEHKDKYYVKEGNSIVSLKKETKKDAFDLAMRLADQYNKTLVAAFKVPKSNPPRYRIQPIQTD